MIKHFRLVLNKGKIWKVGSTTLKSPFLTTNFHWGRAPTCVRVAGALFIYVHREVNYHKIKIQI